MHTTSRLWSISEERRQERECYREDSHTCSRLAHEVSEQEMFASLTCADSWDEVTPGQQQVVNEGQSAWVL